MRLVLAVVLAVGLWSPDKALAKKIDCGVLLERMGKTGEFPGIKLNLAEGTVTVYLSRDHCQESIETWSARPGPGEREKNQPSPSAPKTAPAPAPAPVLIPPKTPALKTTPPPAKTPAFPKIRAACDQRLDRLWPESQVIKIEGISYWLARAFTVNFDGEPGIDDVGFIFKGLDDSERLIRYFGIPGEIPGLSLEELRLADNGLVKRLCFGDVSYTKPPLFGKKLAPKWIEIPKPDLAAEDRARREGRPWPPRGKDKTAKSQKIPEEFSWWLWAAIAGGAVVAIGVGAFFVIRRGPRKKPEDGDKEVGDEEEGEEEDDDEEEDSDEEDDSDGGKKGGKKKKGWLASLFKRGRAKKTKKGSKDDDGDAEED